jgi:cytidylate kinase
LEREQLGALTARIQAARHPIVLIDGGSGSGKSDLATELTPLLAAELVRLEDIYPGWDGLEAASVAVERDILGAGRWQRWDWVKEQPAEWHEIDAARPLIIEGCGALSRTNRALSTFGIWIELDEPTRKARALARDGDTYAPHWDRWAAQEREFYECERPDLLADAILEG